MKKVLTIFVLVGMILVISSTVWAGLTIPDGSMSVGPYNSASPWWDTYNYKRVVTPCTINAQTAPLTVVSGRLSDFSFTDYWGYPGLEAYIEVGLMTDDEYNAMEDYDSATANWDSSSARGSNRGIYLLICGSELYMEDWGGYWPPDGGNFSGQYYPTDDGQTVLYHTLGSDSVLDFSFTMYPSGSAGGIVHANVDVDYDGDGTYDASWTTTDLPYGRYNPVAYDPYHTGDGTAWETVEDFSQAHLFVNVLGYSGNCSFSYSNIQVLQVVPVYSCSGFEAPMDKGAVKVKKNRVLPLKAELFYGCNPVTDADIGENLPYIEVTKEDGGGFTEIIDPEEFLPTGHGTEGNEFIFDGVKWFYNLGTKRFTSAGNYKIIMKSPDENIYIIEPCEAYFNIEKR